MPISDPTARKQYHKAYYEAHRETALNEEKRKRRTRTPEQVADRREYQRRYYAANRDRLLMEQRERGQRNYKARPEAYQKRQRRNTLLREYGLSESDYQAMLSNQQGLCRICDRKMTHPVVDHCHQTGRVRGLLCRGCNAALGHFGDSPVTLARAIRYLTKSSSGVNSTLNSELSSEPSESVA